MPETQGIQSTTQQFLDIYDITNDIVILKDGSTSIILTVNAMNFGLLAEAEQDAVIYSYAALLNSLNYPIQIVIRSQTKDASSYLQLLQEQEDQSTDRIKRDWIRRYKEFVGNLIRERNVLDKKFYVIIPASALEMGVTPGQNLVSGFKTQSIEGVEKSVILEKGRALLEPKRDHLIAQFNRIGLYARQLKTQEIIQLFYTSYNPEAAEGQQITDSRSYTTPMVEAQIRGENMVNATSPTPGAAAPDQTNTTVPQPPTSPVNTVAPTAPVAPPTMPSMSPSAPTVTEMASPATPMTPPSMSSSISTPITPPSSSPTPVAPVTTPVTPSSPSPSMGMNNMATNNPSPTNMAKPINISETPSVSSPSTPSSSPMNSAAPMSNLPSSNQTANPTPSSVNMNSMPSSTGMAPAAPMTVPAPANSSMGASSQSVDQIQNEIDSTLKELNTTGGLTSPSNSLGSTNPSPAPTSVPTPSPVVTPTAPQDADDTLPPLPEI